MRSGFQHPSGRVAGRQMLLLCSGSAAPLHNMQEEECKGREMLSGEEYAEIGQLRKWNRAFSYFLRKILLKLDLPETTRSI